MQSDSRIDPAAYVDGAKNAYACPNCGARGLIRTHRRFVDRFLSLFVKLQRFRCPQFECQWEGNLRVRRAARGKHWRSGRQAFGAGATDRHDPHL